MLQLTILGTNASTPAHNRNTTSQALITQHTGFLIDCGESTQIQMRRHHVKIGKINHILITHLHGDHYLGLIGLLSSMHLQKRLEDLYLYAPKDLAEIVRVNLRCSQTTLSFKVHFIALPENTSEVFYEDTQLTISTIPMNHRIACNGFLFKEKPKKRKIIENTLPTNVPIRTYTSLKNAEDVLDESGNVLFGFEEYTQQPKSYTFAHCSDTKYDESILPHIQKADLIYHEATFLHQDLEKAEMTYHSTALQAATIASKAEVGKLLLGHFSARYKDTMPILEEAKTVFENSFLSVEGEIHQVDL